MDGLQVLCEDITCHRENKQQVERDVLAFWGKLQACVNFHCSLCMTSKTRKLQLLSTFSSFHAWDFSQIDLIVLDWKDVGFLCHYSGLKVNQAVSFWVQFLMKELKGLFSGETIQAAQAIHSCSPPPTAYSVSRLQLTASFGCTGKTKTPGWTALRQMNEERNAHRLEDKKETKLFHKSAQLLKEATWGSSLQYFSLHLHIFGYFHVVFSWWAKEFE